MALTRCGLFQKPIITRISTGITRHFPFILLVLAAAPFFLVRLGQYPAPWFDEGLNLIAVRTMAETGQYGLMAASGVRLADPAVQTGLPILILLTSLHQSFGSNIAVMRLLVVFFGAAALVALYALTQRLYDRKTAFMAVAVMLGMPVVHATAHVIPMSRQVLGEMPAVFFIALGLLIAAREKTTTSDHILIGLCFGLAVTIKSQVLIVLSISLLMWLLYCLVVRQASVRLWVTAAFVMGGMYLLDSFWRWQMAGSHRAENAGILLQGIQIHLLALNPLRNLASRTTWFFLGLAGTGLAGVVFRRRSVDFTERQRSSAHQVEGFLLLFVAIWMLWYAVASIGWPRYAFVGHVFSLVLVASTVLHRFRLPEGRYFYGIQLVVVIVAMALFQMPLIQDRAGDDFYRMADYLKTRVNPGAVIVSWELPLAYVADQLFEYPTTDITNAVTANAFHQSGLEIYYDPMAVCPDYLLYGWFKAGDYVIGTEHVKQLVFESEVYRLYAVENSCEPVTS